MKPRLLTIDEIAGLVADDRANIIEFIREDRVPYVSFPDGILIPLGMFQMCMNDLYNLYEALREIDRATRTEDDDV